MGDITLSLKSLCLVSIISGILSALLPDGGIKKAFYSLCAIVMIYSLISAFSSFEKNDFAKEKFSRNKFEKNISEQEDTAQLMIYEKVVSDALGNILKSKWNVYGVEVSASYNDKNAEINSLKVTGELSDAEKNEIEILLNDKFEKIQIIFEVENSG